MSTNNGTNPTPLYAWLVGQKERLEADIAARKAELEEVEVAMAALAHRQAPPMAAQSERAECRNCSGPIARVPGGPWLHDRDGMQGCKPGHSGPVAEPLGQTTAFVPITLDPDCRDGKHGSCMGGPCQCPCHQPADAATEVIDRAGKNPAAKDGGAK